MSAPFILKFAEGTGVSRKALEEYIDHQDPDRFSMATLKSTAQNLDDMNKWLQEVTIILKEKVKNGPIIV
jgi:hypothetical protein